MIGDGIFALTGQIAELAGPWFPLSFLLGALIVGFSAYSYIRMSNAWPSAGGVAMILQKCYGTGAVAAGAALLMALSMVIAESLVARTFATYVLRPFDIEGGPLVPLLAVGAILFAYLVNIAGNRSVGTLSLVMAAVKIGGIALFGVAAALGSNVEAEVVASAFAGGSASLLSVIGASGVITDRPTASPPDTTKPAKAPSMYMPPLEEPPAIDFSSTLTATTGGGVPVA